MYNLDEDVQYRRVPGKFEIVAQVNENRSKKRRMPMKFHSMKDPFDPNAFHFGKINPKEVKKLEFF